MEFRADYYTGGNYQDYLDRHQIFMQQARDILEAMRRHHPAPASFLDFGCAVGGLVAALHGQGVKVAGTDISPWAIEYGRKQHNLPPEILQHYNHQLLQQPVDAVLFMDVLEHMFEPELITVLSLLAAPIIVVRVPVSLVEGQDFVLDVSRNDKTHVQIHCKDWWDHLFRLHRYGLAEIIVAKSIYDSPGVLARLYKRM